jgi:alkanesulfonate monooxygenase SsuD/methylene tetrahydromethanopterin reductase-like flavin-dependent oxidoreductase (luciferase family)
MTPASRSASERLRKLVEQIERTDQLGLDVFGVGEHHRREFPDSAPVYFTSATILYSYTIVSKT